MALEPPADTTSGAPEATDDGGDVLARALQAVRGERPADWEALADTVMRRVRAVVVPAYPLLVRELPDGSRSYVSSRVVTTGVRLLLRREPTHAPSGIRLHLDQDRLTGLDLALVASYGVDLVALAARLRVEVVAEIAGLTGLPALDPAVVSVEFVDVVEGDPRVV